VRGVSVRALKAADVDRFGFGSGYGGYGSGYGRGGHGKSRGGYYSY